MRIRTALLLLLALLFASFGTRAEVLLKSNLNPWATSSAYQKAMTALDKGELDEAFTWFDKEMKLHPNNGYALVNWGCGKALSALLEFENVNDEEDGTLVFPPQFSTMVDEGIGMMEKGISLIPSNDSKSVCDACRMLSSTIDIKFQSMPLSTDSAKQQEYLHKAIETHPCEEVFMVLMEKKFIPGDLNSIKDEIALFYEKCPTNPNSVAMMAKLMEVQGNYDKAIQLVDNYTAMQKEKGQSLDGEMLLLKAQTLTKLGRQSEATDILFHIIENPSIEGYSNAPEELLRIAATAPEEVLMKLRQREFTSEGSLLWPLMQGMVYSYSLHDYSAAIPYFESVQERNPGDKSVINNLAYCYYMTGKVDNALVYADASDRLNDNSDKMSMLLKLGRLDEIIASRKALVSLDNIVDVDKSDYSFLGKLYYLKKDYVHALSMLDKALAIDDSIPEANFFKGKILKEQGNEISANSYFEKAASVVSPHITSPDLVIGTMSLAELGRLNEAREANDMLAREWDEALRQKDPTNVSVEGSTSAYEIAGIYSMIGDTEKALKYLDNHFQHDYLCYNFGLMNLDWRFDNLRQLHEYVNIVNKYYVKWKGNQASN